MACNFTCSCAIDLLILVFPPSYYACKHRQKKQFHFGGGANITYTVICAACMNINKVSRIKHWGGGGGGGGGGLGLH